MPFTVGIDIGGTKISAALVTRVGQISVYNEVSTPATDPKAVIQTVITLIRRISDIAASQHLKIVGIGVGTAGQVNVETGTVVYAVDTLSSWKGTEIAEVLSTAFALPVTVDNDVNAMAIAELRFGAGLGLTSTLYAAVGTGIGGAVVINGQLWRGANWSAGELGHIPAVWNGEEMCNCGQGGHLEAYAAGPALARRYYKLKGLEISPDLRPVALAAQQGDTVALSVITEGAQILGTVLAGLVNVIDPQALIIGGGVIQLGDLWWIPFEKAVHENPLPASRYISIKQAKLGHHAVIIGAALSAWEKLT
ncbi:MAG: ROK family protein [Anaerolineae bacterium]